MSSAAVGASGADWLRSRFEKIQEIMEKRRIALVEIFERNAEWMQNEAAKLVEHSQRKPASKLKKASERQRRDENAENVNSKNERTNKTPLRKRGRRKKELNNFAESVSSAPEITRLSRPPRGRTRKARPSDSFVVHQSEDKLLLPTPKTPSLQLQIQAIEEVIISSEKSAANSMSIIAEPTKSGNAEHAESVSETVAAVSTQPQQHQEATDTTVPKTDINPQWVTVSQSEASVASFAPSPVLPQKNTTDFKIATPLDALPKVDSWTSQFLRPKNLTLETLQTPSSKRTAVSSRSSTKKKRPGLAIVDAPLPITKPAVPTFAENTSVPVISIPVINDALPEESPLSKAKRLDSEYTQREQKLKAYLANGSDGIKKKLDGLRGPNVEVRGDKETEALPRVADNPKPAKPVTASSIERPSEIPKSMKVPPTEKSEIAAKRNCEGDEKKATMIGDILAETPPMAIRKFDVLEEPEALKPDSKQELTATGTSGRAVEAVSKDMPSSEEPGEAIGATRSDSMNSTASAATNTSQTSVAESQPDHFDHVRKAAGKGELRTAVEEQRKRLQERQAKAIERKKLLLEKAQSAKGPKEPSFAAIKPVTKPQQLPLPSQNLPKPVSTTNLPPPPKVSPAIPLTPETQKSYKLPLPKTKSPIVTNAKKEGTETPESLPEIKSEEDPSTLRKKNIPAWAKTPALATAIASQSNGPRPEDIFGDVQPIKLEEFFKGKKFSRSSTSGWNHHY